MRLVDLEPQWVDRPWDNRWKIGISFKCSHCEERCLIYFRNPLDGGQSKGPEGHPRWERQGDSFENLSLVPSVKWEGHMHVSVVGGGIKVE